MKLIIDIPKETVNEIKAGAMFAGTIPSGILWDVTSAIVNDIPHETVTEFADRCRECGRERVLDKIRAEIEALDDGISNYHDDRPWIFKDEALDIIDKYRNEVSK